MGKILIGLTSEISFLIVDLLIYAEERIRSALERDRLEALLSVCGVFEANC